MAAGPGSALDRRASITVRLARKRKPAVVGYLERSDTPLPEEQQGLAISTFGKVIKRGWEWLGLTPSTPDRIGGLVEAPPLSAALALNNKADFIRTGALAGTADLVPGSSPALPLGDLDALDLLTPSDPDALGEPAAPLRDVSRRHTRSRPGFAFASMIAIGVGVGAPIGDIMAVGIRADGPSLSVDAPRLLIKAATAASVFHSVDATRDEAIPLGQVESEAILTYTSSY